jgi:hypothetical protein
MVISVLRPTDRQQGLEMLPLEVFLLKGNNKEKLMG